MKRKDAEYVLRKLGSRDFKMAGSFLMTNCPYAQISQVHKSDFDRKPSFGVHIGPGVSASNCFTCFTKDTLVATDTGWLPIEKVEVGSYVLSEGNAFRPVVDKLVRDYSGQMCRVKISGLPEPHVCTSNHEFYVIRTQKCPYKKHETACTSHCKKTCKRFYRDYVIRKIPARELTKLDYVVLPAYREQDIDTIEPALIRERGVPGTKPVELPRKINVDYDFLRFIGLYIAEGSYSCRNVVFTFNADENELGDFTAKYLAKLGLKAVRRAEKNKQNVYCSSVALGKWLTELCGSGAANKHIPQCLARLPRGKMLELISGIADGDGTREKDGCFSIKTTSRVLAQQIFSVMLGFEDKLCSVASEEEKIDKNGVVHRKAYRIRITDRGCRNGSVKRILGCTASRVVKVEHFEDSTKVYNLTVAGTHNYVAGGALVANCGPHGGLLKVVMDVGRALVRKGEMTKKHYDELVDYVLLNEEDEGAEEVKVGAPKEIPVPDDVLACLGKYHPYMEKRGIDQATAKEWRLGFSAPLQRVLFPLITMVGKVPVVQGRTLLPESKSNPKYRTWPKAPEDSDVPIKSQYLYGEHLIVPRRVNSERYTKILIAVEGIMDALKANMMLKAADMSPQYVAVAVMGNRPSDVQMERMVDYAEEVVEALDNDPAGRYGAKVLVEGIGKRVRVTALKYPPKVKDPDELGHRFLEVLGGRCFALEMQLAKLLKRSV